ncbi:hypothetical protein RF11_10635 [Thelohanellus kitauei]|uniref:ISXO2-like transposase domain-containing protein n=1 Tax=Thelohanellus kitauei TaxID=669202 RepID=A0A0C2MPD8_THEKT|nr:hypothetical protein RF11_10635 [Thelohanellus kitauei]
MAQHKRADVSDQICSWKISTIDLKLGGPGRIVQIDESVISRAMHNRGVINIILGHDLLRRQRWVLGMYDVTSKVRIYLTSGLEELQIDPPYVHQSVNHKIFFKDPLTGAHTNNVEAYWAAIKKSFKRGGQTRRSLLQSKIDEKMWRERFAKTPEEAFENIMSQIAEFSNLN